MINLNDMDLSQLKKLQKRVARAIESFEDRKKAVARKAVEEIAQEHGFTITDLFDIALTKKTRKPATAKFANPANSADTWSGRGRQPQWFKATISGGQTADSMLVGAHEPEDLAVEDAQKGPDTVVPLPDRGRKVA